MNLNMRPSLEPGQSTLVPCTSCVLSLTKRDEPLPEEDGRGTCGTAADLQDNETCNRHDMFSPFARSDSQRSCQRLKQRENNKIS